MNNLHTHSPQMSLIGRREYVHFPELDLQNIEAKIDTGAYTTALHCKNISIKNIQGKNTLCFTLLDETHPEYNQKELHYEHFTQKNIKSSSGETELRYIIKTLLLIGKKRIKTTVSLTNRGNMRYPILIGRKLLKNKFLVDVAKIHTGGILIKK
ncbi:MAG: ATP-dependent zinc protease [Bacteroidetes bacterium]|nr:ATP-dependent zinc protease [Bacteroidota bacterium]